MKIVERPEFLKMPVGTLYSEWTDCVFGELRIKGETIGHPSVDTGSSGDFFYQSIADALEYTSDCLHDICQESIASGKSMPMDFHSESRDGTYDWCQFAVWDRTDVESLIRRLHEAITDAGPALGHSPGDKTNMPAP